MNGIINEVLEYCQNDMEYLQELIDRLQEIVDNSELNLTINDEMRLESEEK